MRRDRLLRRHFREELERDAVILSPMAAASVAPLLERSIMADALEPRVKGAAVLELRTPLENAKPSDLDEVISIVRVNAERREAPIEHRMMLAIQHRYGIRVRRQKQLPAVSVDGAFRSISKLRRLCPQFFRRSHARHGTPCFYVLPLTVIVTR